MFNPRDYIGMSFDIASAQLKQLGYSVEEKPNTEDNKHKYDTKLVVRVDVNDKSVTLVTAKFLMNI